LARLLLVRHGITEWNIVHRIQGHTDNDLNEKGTRQVERVGERLAGEKIDAVFASDLKRTLSTAQAAVGSRNIEIRTSADLREMNYGLAEGMTYGELKAAYPEIAASLFNFHTGIIFPEGETFLGFVDRAESFLKSLTGYPEDSTILVVTHGGVIKTMVCSLLRIGQVHWPKIRIDNASLTIVSTYGERVILSLLNDTSHLGDLKEPY